MIGDTEILRRRQPRKIGRDQGSWLHGLLIALALSFVAIFLLLPLVNVFFQAFKLGGGFYLQSVKNPDTWHAIRLTLLVASISVPLNMVFGLAAAWAIAKFEFRGKAILLTLIDLPFAISPVVAGLMILLLFGRQGFFGPWLADQGIGVVFAVPGMVLATVFITFPFVARELIPIMENQGTEQEQAALTLGANGWQMFWKVTLPSVRWGLLYGVILCNARAMGEFGAVSVVSGHITAQTDTMPLRVEKLFHGTSEESVTAAFVVASLLTLLALITLGIKSWLEWKMEKALIEGAKNPGKELSA